MEWLATINGYVNDFVWGAPCIILILGVGLFMTIRLKGMQFKNLGFQFRDTYVKAFQKSGVKKGQGDISSYQAAMVSVSAVVGSGNIAGVSTAIVTGGPGALFWMVIASIVGMATKYAEIALGIKYREKMDNGTYAGGPMYYLSKGLKQKWLGGVFSILMIFAGFMISAVVDTNTMANAVNEKFGVTPLVTGVVLAVLTAIVIFGGIKRIGQVCGWLSPFMAGAYLLCGIVIILINITSVPAAIVQIVQGAFNPTAVMGGAAGTGVMAVIRVGLARGIFSNEAGIGTAAITHSAASVETPGEQAAWGPLEVFVDTCIVCMITGLTIVLSGLWQSGADGAVLTMRAFDKLLPGHLGGYVVMLAALLFGYSCLISWFNYVEKASDYLFGSKAISVMKILWIIFILIGSHTTLGMAWDLADTANGLLIIPNLIGLIILSGQVVKIKDDYYKTALPAYKKEKAEKKATKAAK